MKVQLLFVLILIMSACTEKVEQSFYYADGSQIADSNDIRIVSQELDSLLHNNLNTSLKIHSTLFPKSRLDCSPLLDSLRFIMRKNLIEHYPEFKEQITALNPESILKSGIIVIDNKSGQIISYKNYAGGLDLISDFPLTSHKFYGLILAMDKEFEADDEYVYWQESGIINSDGKKDTTQYEIKHTLKWLFSTGPVGPVTRYPYRHYSIADWKNIDKKWKLNLDFSEYHSSYQAIMSRMIDLTKTYAMINNNGIYKSSSIIKEVLNQNEINVYKKHHFSEQLISSKTLKELEELLEYNMIYGQGGFVKKNLSLDDNHTVFFGQSGPNVDWILCANQNFTIGIITQSKLVVKSTNNGNRSLTLSGWNPPRKCMPILKFMLDELSN